MLRPELISRCGGHQGAQNNFHLSKVLQTEEQKQEPQGQGGETLGCLQRIVENKRLLKSSKEHWREKSYRVGGKENTFSIRIKVLPKFIITSFAHTHLFTPIL